MPCIVLADHGANQNRQGFCPATCLAAPSGATRAVRRPPPDPDAIRAALKKNAEQWLRICLTSRYGWRDGDTGEWVSLKWEGLSRSKRDDQDRPIEAALRPRLVESFLKHLAGLKEGDVYDEWNAIEKVLRAWKSAG